MPHPQSYDIYGVGSNAAAGCAAVDVCQLSNIAALEPRGGMAGDD